MLIANLRVGQKILVIVALVWLVLSTVLLASFFSFTELRHSLDEIRDEGVPNALLAKDLQLQVVQIQQFLSDISATRGQDGLDDGFPEAEKAYKAALDDLAKLRSAFERKGDPAGIEQADRLKEKLSAWYAIGRRMAQAYVDDGPAGGNRVMMAWSRLSPEKSPRPCAV